MDRSFSSSNQGDHAPPDVVLYHADCSDGFGAAWALWKKYPKAKYQPVKHGFPPPTNLAGRHIVMVDFSYSRPALETMAQQAASLQVLDHHITAQDALEAEGRAILRYETELVGKIAASAVLLPFEGAIVPVVNSTVLTSQIGERLSAHHPFCVMWHDRDGRRYYSLRSRDDGADVAAIATQYGGGGHTHAAGFSVALGAHARSPFDPLPALPDTAKQRAGRRSD